MRIVMEIAKPEQHLILLTINQIDVERSDARVVFFERCLTMFDMTPYSPYWRNQNPNLPTELNITLSSDHSSGVRDSPLKEIPGSIQFEVDLAVCRTFEHMVQSKFFKLISSQTCYFANWLELLELIFHLHAIGSSLQLRWMKFLEMMRGCFTR